MGEYYGVRMKDDPNGEYLQHWGIPKGFMREGHKYLARLVTPSGYRYLYTQAQVAAAKAGKAIGNAIGLNQRNRAQQATARAQRISGGNKGREQSVQGIKRARMAKSTAKRAQSAYDKTLLGRAEKAFNSARKGLDDFGRQASKQARKIQRNVSRTAQNVGKQAGRTVDNIVGGSAKKNLKRQQDRYNKAMASDAYLDMPYNDERRRKTAQRDARVKNAQQAYSKAEDRYGRTLMGRAEKARENAGRAISGAGRAISDAVNRPLRNAIGNTATMKRIDQAQAKRGRNARKEKTQQARVNAKQPTGSAVAKVTGAAQRTRLLKEGANYNRALAREHAAKERADNSVRLPQNPDSPRPSMTEAKIARMKRATAKRATEARHKADARYTNAANAYARTPLGKAEEQIVRRTGTNTLMNTYDKYYGPGGKRRKKRR